MNIRIRPLLAALLILPSAARAYDFTRPDGSTISGEITAIGAGQVTIRTTDSRELRLPVAILTKADEQYARRWWNENRKYWFIISADSKMVTPAAAKVSQGELTVSKRDYAYTVTVRNNTAYATPDLQAEYALFMTKPGQRTPSAAATGTIHIPALKPGGTHEFETASVDISTYRPPEGFHFINGHDRRHKDTLQGMTLKLATGGKGIWVHESSPGLLGTTLSLGAGMSIRVSDNSSSRPYSGPPTGLAAALAGSMKGRVTFSSRAP
jgi:hypothetical protein